MKQKIRGKLGHVVQIYVCRLFVSVNLNLSTDSSVRFHRKVLSLREGPHTALTVQQNGSHFEVFATLRSCGR